MRPVDYYTSIETNNLFPIEIEEPLTEPAREYVLRRDHQICKQLAGLMRHDRYLLTGPGTQVTGYLTPCSGDFNAMQCGSGGLNAAVCTCDLVTWTQVPAIDLPCSGGF